MQLIGLGIAFHDFPVLLLNWIGPVQESGSGTRAGVRLPLEGRHGATGDRGPSGGDAAGGGAGVLWADPPLAAARPVAGRQRCRSGAPAQRQGPTPQLWLPATFVLGGTWSFLIEAVLSACSGVHLTVKASG